MQGTELPPIPNRTPTDPEQFVQLDQARRRCVEAMFEVDEAERQATQARRKARRLRKTYERMLLEYLGQERLPGMEGQ